MLRANWASASNSGSPQSSSRIPVKTSRGHTSLKSREMSAAFPVDSRATCPQCSPWSRWSTGFWRKFCKCVSGPLQAFMIPTVTHQRLSLKHSSARFLQRPILALKAFDSSICNSSISTQLCFLSLSSDLESTSIMIGASLSIPVCKNLCSGLSYPLQRPDDALGQSCLHSSFADR